MNKKIIALLVTMSALSSGGFQSVSAASYDAAPTTAVASVDYNKQVFADVPASHWAYSYINEMYDRGVVNGFPDGNFYPSATVTRAEFAKMMTTAANINVASYGTATGYPDVPQTHWAACYVAAAKSYLSDYESANGMKTFRPDIAAVREDIAVAMVKLKGIDVKSADESVLKKMFSDYLSISSGARKYIAAAIENGIVSGYEDGTFRAQATVTRAEAVAMMWRAFQYGSETKNWDNEPNAVTTDQMVPPVFANADKDKKDDDDLFNQPAAPTLSTNKNNKLNDDEDDNKSDKKNNKKDDDEDDIFNQPAAPTLSTGKHDKVDKDDEKSEKPAKKEEKEPEEDNNGEMYYVDTLDDSFKGSMTAYTAFDENSNTVYWYNASENVIKCMDGDSREVEEYLDINNMKILDDGTVTFDDTDEAFYGSITVTQIFYDAYEDNMIIDVTANYRVDPNLLEAKEIAGYPPRYLYTFDGDEFVEMDAKFGNKVYYNNLFEYTIHESNKDYYIATTSNGVPVLINKRTGKNVSYPDIFFQNVYVQNGDIYAITSSGKMANDTSKLYKCNVSSGSTEWEVVQDVGMSMGSVAKDSKFYIFDLNRYAIVSCNSKGKLTKEMDLSNLKTLDMLSVRFGSDHASESGSIIITNNMNVIYYDGTNDVMRIIYKD